MNWLHSIVYIFKVPGAVSLMLKNLAVQRNFIKRSVAPILKEAYAINDGQLDESDAKKINEYYGLAVPAVLGEAFCALHQKQMTEKERIASTSQGAMTGLFDDFFDKQYLSADNIEQLLNENNDRLASNEKLFNEFYKNALQHVPERKAMIDALMEVYHAQVASKKQNTSTISQKEIEEITWYKGGVSVIFYRTAFLPSPSAKEQQLLYKLGSLMQLCNDIFDVYKDREHHIKTLITEATHINKIRSLLQQELIAQQQFANEAGFDKSGLKKFFSILNLGIFSRAFVCLDQLEQLERTTNDSFNVHAYSRKQLICDMEKKSNQLRSAWYYIKLMQL